MNTALITEPLTAILNSSQAGLERDTSIDTQLLGTLFESALVHYLFTQSEVDQIAFGEWVQAHARDTNFFTDVCRTYPPLYIALENEIKALTSVSQRS